MRRRPALVAVLSLLFAVALSLAAAPRLGVAQDAATPVSEASAVEVEGVSVEVLGATTRDGERTEALVRWTLAPGAETPPTVDEAALTSAFFVVEEGAVELVFVEPTGEVIVGAAPGSELATEQGVCAEGSVCPVDLERVGSVVLGPGSTFSITETPFVVVAPDGATLIGSIGCDVCFGHVPPGPRPKLEAFQR